MADSYSVKARLSATDSGFSSTLKNAIGMTDTFKSKLSSIGSGILQGVGQKLFSGISSGIGDMVGELNSSNAAWKTFEGNMSMLGKSAKEVSGVKKELQAFATESIYSASDMATTYSQLAAVGVSNTTELVKGFGGLAAAAENPQQAMKTLSQQATQMAAKPSVAWADFKLMLEQTPAGISAVAKAMGMSTSELVQNVQAGTVATDEFFAAIVKAGGSGTELNKLATEYKTIDQAVGGLKEPLATKLAPAFDVVSNIGIKAISGIVDALGKIDGQAIANKVTGWIKKAQPYWTSFKNAVVKVWGVISGVAKSLAPIFSALGSKIAGSFKTIMDKIGSIDVESAVNKISGAITKAKPYFDAFVNTFKAIGQACAPVISWLMQVGSAIANYLLNNSEKISKIVPYIIGAVGAFKGFQIVKAIAPSVASFATNLLKMAGKGIAGLAGKLFGIAGAQKAVGTASQSSGPSIMQSAVATLALGAAVLLAAVGLALLVQSAIALATAGWPAVAVLVGLVAIIVLLAVGAAALGPALTAGAVGFLAFGAAIALVGAGAMMAGIGLSFVASAMPLIVAYGLQGAVSLLALGGALVVFSVGAALAGVACIALGTGLLVIATALLVAGSGMLLLGVGALLAVTSLLLLTQILPILTTYGLQGSIAIIALGAALLIFGAGALVAGAGALVLGAGLLVMATALSVAAAAFLVLSVGALITAASLAILSAVLPIIAAYGLQGALAITALGVSMVVFAAGALLAGVAALVLSAGILVACVGLAAAAVTVGILAAAMVVLAAATVIVAAGFGVIALAINTVVASGALAGAVLTGLNVPMLAFSPAATTAGAAAGVLAAGFATLAVATAALAVAMLALGIGLLTVGAGAMLSAAGFALLSVAMTLLCVNAQQNAIALATLGAGLLAFAPGALVAGAAAVVLGAGLIACAVGMVLMGAAVIVTTAAMIALSVGLLLVTASAAVTTATLMVLIATMPMLVAMALLTTAAMAALLAITVALSAIFVVTALALTTVALACAACAIAITAFGLAVAGAALGAGAFALAVVAIAESFKTIGTNAKTAKDAITNMQNSVNAISSGLDALGSKAEAGMKKLDNVFKKGADDAYDSGSKLGKEYTNGMQSGLLQAIPIALQSVIVVNTTLMAGYAMAYKSGAHISQGFAKGMLSCLATIRSAAAQMAAAADEAIRAKAKIHSPSKVAQGLGAYFGEGYANGISDMVKTAWRAAEDLVTIPAIATPDLAMAYSGELGADYSYSNNSEYLIEVSLPIDGKEFARVTVPYTQAEINRQETRVSRKHGRV